jgi:hypothetical protein
VFLCLGKRKTSLSSLCLSLFPYEVLLSQSQGVKTSIYQCRGRGDITQQIALLRRAVGTISVQKLEDLNPKKS